MAKVTKKWALIASLSLAAVLFAISAGSAQAAVLFQSGANTFDNIGSSGFRWFGTTYLPQTSQRVCSVGFAVGNNSGDTDGWTIYLRSGGSDPDGGTLIDSIATTAGQWSTSTTPGFTSFDFDNCHTLTGGGTYFFALKKNGGAGFTTWKMGKTIGANEAELTNVWTYNGSAWSQFTGTQELGVQVSGDAGNAVEITFPTATSYSGDFNSFWLSYAAGAGETTFRVYYATSSANLNSSSTRWEDTNGLSLGGQVFGSAIPVVKTNTLLPGLGYYARAQLEQNGTNIATSTEVSFEIAGGGSLDSFSRFLITTQPTSTSTALTVTCDPDSSFFANSFCKLFQYLFVPDPGIWDSFKGLQSELAAKPPFGYVSSVTSALSGDLVSSSTPATTGFDVLSGVSDIFDDLRTMLQWALWLIFTFWLFNKFRNFKY